MNDLVTWLHARLGEDERIAQDGRDWHHHVCGIGASMLHEHFTADRLLAEVEAKRQLLETILNYEAKIDGEWGCCHSADGIAKGLCPETPPDEIKAVRLLALPYADRPGYREEWRPSAERSA